MFFIKAAAYFVQIITIGREERAPVAHSLIMDFYLTLQPVTIFMELQKQCSHQHIPYTI